MSIRKHLSVIAAASLLTGCSVMDSVWGVLSGGNGTPATGRVIAVPTPKSETSVSSSALAGSTTPMPSVAFAPGGDSGRAPGATPTAAALLAQSPAAPAAAPTAPSVAAQPAAPLPQGLRGELRRLQEDVARQNGEIQHVHQALAQDGANYYGMVATIHSRLQVGTTPGNPELVAQWNLAQVALDRISADIARLALLSGEVASDSTLGTQILEGLKAGGDGTADPRQIETGTTQAQGQVELLVNAVAQDIARQAAYLDNERTNLVGLLAAIKGGELYGKRLPDGRYVASLKALDLLRLTAVSGSSERRPLVVIRFRDPDVAYEEKLYGAVKQALERRPGATFELVAVAPVATTPAQVDANGRTAKRYAATVLRSLTQMGLPADRVSLSAMTRAEAKNDEVEIYVR
jgi:hypothetical protein